MVVYKNKDFSDLIICSDRCCAIAFAIQGNVLLLSFALSFGGSLNAS